MRAYKAPGIYSTFVPAQEVVSGGRSLRRLAIVGPGQKFFVRENVAVERSEKAIFDELENDGLIDIISASSCKIKNGKPVYSDGEIFTNYIIKDGKVIWLPADEDGNIADKYLIPATCYKELTNIETEGSKLLMSEGIVDAKITLDADGKAMNEILEDADYVLTVNNIDKIGTFTVANEKTEELIGEYHLSDTTMEYREDIIKGVSLRVIGTAIDEETGEYLFGDNVKVGDAIRICVRAAKNRVDAKAFLNFFAVPRDEEGKPVTDVELLNDFAYSKTNADGTAFDATTGLKVVVNDTAAPADNEIKLDAANAKAKAGETFAAGDFIGKVPVLVLEGKANVTDLYKLSNDSYEVDVVNGTNQLVIDYKKENFGGYTLDGEKICKYNDAALAQYNADHGENFALTDIQYNSRGETIEDAKLTFSVKFATGVKPNEPIEGFRAGNIYVEAEDFAYITPEQPETSRREITGIKVYQKDKKNVLTAIPTGLKFVLAIDGVETEYEPKAAGVTPDTTPAVTAEDAMENFKKDLIAVLNAKDDTVNPKGKGLEVAVDPFSPLAIISIKDLNTFVKDVEILKKKKLANADYVVEYVSGATEKSVAIRISKIMPKKNKSDKIVEALVPISGAMKVSMFKNNVINSIIPGVSFVIDAKGLATKVAARDVTRGDILGIISTRPDLYPDGQPADGDVYYISYKYKRTDFAPKLFTEYEDIVEVYGNYNVALNGYVANGVTLAAQLAMQNGAEEIIIAQIESDTNQGYFDAIDKLANIDQNIISVDLIVPLTTNFEVIKYLSDHVTLYSSDDFCLYRMGYVGAAKDEVIDSESLEYTSDELGSIQKTMSLKNERMVYVCPGTVVKTVINSATGYSVKRVLTAPYAAAAVAGLAMRNDLAEPLTNKIVYGFDSLGTIYKETEANKLANAGCLVLKQDKNEIRVRHGITTFYEFQTFNDVHSNEITFIQIKDRVISLCRSELGKKYVGNKLKASVVNDVEYTLTQILNTLAAAETIVSYEGVSVTRDIDNPMQINIRFFIEAVYPLNFLEVEFGFSTTISE